MINLLYHQSHKKSFENIDCDDQKNPEYQIGCLVTYVNMNCLFNIRYVKTLCKYSLYW